MTAARDARSRVCVEDPSIETRIERVTDGFFNGPLAEQMKEADVPGISIAEIDTGRIGWARGFGVKRAMNSNGVDEATMWVDRKGTTHEPVCPIRRTSSLSPPEECDAPAIPAVHS